jgi:murein DD-endopeptidase MepM/ murein hydrolase activator NlpD
MSQEKFNILISSDQRLKTINLSLSKTAFTFICALCLLAVFVLIFIILDYFSLVIKDTRHSYLLEQNKELKVKLKGFSEQMEAVNIDLEKVNRFSRKLKAITSGGNEPERQLELSLGAPLIEVKEEDSINAQASESLGSDLGDSATEGPFPLFKKNNYEFAFANPIAEADLSFVFKTTRDKTTKMERELTLLFEKMASQQDLLQATPSIRPTLGGWVSSGFGYRVDPFTGRRKMHKGLDFAAMTGTPVYSPADGVVSYAGREGGYGKIVSIDHGYGIVTRYAHNSRLLVKTGQRVTRWEKIAEVGSTGRSSGPHLHYEVRLNGVPVDPEKYILTN